MAEGGPPTLDDTVGYCAAELRRHDSDRYLTALFAPPSRRADLFALYAFNLEISRAREMVREPMVGRMRLQWWRDSIEGIYAGSVRRHAIVEPLAHAIARHDLSRATLDRLIDARESDMIDEPPADLPALVAYAEATASSLIELALAIVGKGDAIRAGPAARSIGIAWSLIGLLRAVPFHARGHRLYLPRALLDQAGVAPHQLFDLQPPPALARVVEAIVGEAARQLGEGRAAARGLPRHVLPALLPAVLADLYLQRLRAASYNPFDPRVQEAPPGRIWRLAYAMLRARL
jgi:NADH dehydrogenase [ubiquinone] 1 alpha subcomplex assembly factor 6